jgi:hypothetical protein
MKCRYFFIPIILVLLTTVTSYGQHDCSIVVTGSPVSYCVGKPYTFRISCDTHPRETTWMINGQDVATATDYVFSQAGSYTITATGKFATPYEGDWDYADVSITINVGSSLATPQIAASKLKLCDNENVTLNITNVDSRLTYAWTSDPPGFAGMGSQVSFGNISSSVKFIATPSGMECAGTDGNIVIQGISTLMSPVLDPQTPYHKRYLSGSVAGNAYYWQSSASLTSTSSPVQGTLTVTQEGDYWIRRFDSNANCWAMASMPVHVALNFAPPLPNVAEVKQAGYSQFYFTDSNKDFLLQFADYYWVADNSSNPTIVKPFIESQQMKNDKFYVNGVYYLKGRDKATGTWGSTLSITVVVREQDELNYIHTWQFDGTNQTSHYDNGTLAGESRTYSDETGKVLQTQSKSMQSVDTPKPYVLVTQDLCDKYNRIVGSTLPAPVFSLTFDFAHLFVANAEGNVYDYRYFDGPKRMSPDPVENTKDNTLGRYYSEGSDEEHVPVTQYPYSTTEYYSDGTGAMRRTASPGDEHRMGNGHERIFGSFPVYNELSDYLTRRQVAISNVSQNPNALGNGSAQNLTCDENGSIGQDGRRLNIYSINILDKDGKVVMSAHSGHGEHAPHDLKVDNVVTSNGNPTSPDYRKLTYFFLLEDADVSIIGSSDFVAEDILSDVKKNAGQTFQMTNGKWPAGFYRIILPNTNSAITLSYTNYYRDVAYQFYDDAGRLKVSVSPNGVRDWRASGDAAYPTIDKTVNYYNFQGWLMRSENSDAGASDYKYRKDGKIRFSQDEAQRLNESTLAPNMGRFSYTNYDKLGRPVESGEYKGTQYNFADVTDHLEVDEQENFASIDKRDWVLTAYDTPPDMELSSLGNSTGLPATYQQQNFLRGAVAKTQNANSRTWYSYDEQGRVSWMVQKPDKLSMAFVVKYDYDFLGNVLKISNLAYSHQPGLTTGFYHYYEYDADKRLRKVSTSTVDGGEQKTRALYSYYLHGPLKRVVLGDNLQGVDFVYNIRGWLTQINHPDRDKDPGGDANDAFGMIINYFETEANAPALSALDPLKKTLQFHKLPEGGTASEDVSYLPESYPQKMPTLTSPLKKYSAEQTDYRTQLEQLMKPKQGKSENSVINSKG